MELGLLTESALIERLQMGEVGSFEEIHRRYSGPVYGFLRKKLGNGSTEIDELYQETFLKLYQARARIDAQRPLAPWIFTLCRNILNDHLRRVQSGDKGFSQFELHEKLLHSFRDSELNTPEIPLSQLTPEHREVIRLRVHED